MPASDYTSTVSGGLKLKGGAKDGGIKKKKKSSSSGSKKKSESEDKKSAIEPTTGDEGSESAAAGESSTALTRQPPQIDEDDEEQALESRSRSRSGSAVPTNIAGSGKTEAQRRHEEIKRKRVSENIHTYASALTKTRRSSARDRSAG
jgi:protein FAM32A